MSKTNKLYKETSPYLLQHSENPVDWHPWTEQSLKKAKTLNKPILHSIGYSACHWFHVMAHESFEDGAISGGAGSAVSEWAQENKMKHQIIICGIPDEFVEHASRAEMLEIIGLDKKGILAKVKDCLT